MRFALLSLDFVGGGEWISCRISSLAIEVKYNCYCTHGPRSSGAAQAAIQSQIDGQATRYLLGVTFAPSLLTTPHGGRGQRLLKATTGTYDRYNSLVEMRNKLAGLWT